MIINSTNINHNDESYYYSDSFPVSYENSDLTNRTYYDDYLINNDEAFNITNTNVLSLSSLFSLSSPFSYIIIILMIYIILTIILLALSLYKQRQSELENSDFDETDDDVEQAKRCSIWKQLLIEKIQKGDMEPLLSNSHHDSHDIDSESRAPVYPIQIV